MARLYRTQAARLRSLVEAAAVVTLSSHMAEEMRRNGVHADRVHVVPPFISCVGGAPCTPPGDLHSAGAAPPAPFRSLLPVTGGAPCTPPVADVVRLPPPAGGPVRLLYLGRLEPLKGVADLLQALRPAAGRLRRSMRLTIAGEGSARLAHEHQAAAICNADPRVEIRFVGWQDDAGRARLLSEPERLARLSAGARRGAASWTLERHLAGLVKVLQGAAGCGQVRPARNSVEQC
jgi:glycosyltransferase involved in cell wall biosynthesis